METPLEITDVVGDDFIDAKSIFLWGLTGGRFVFLWCHPAKFFLYQSVALTARSKSSQRTDFYLLSFTVYF